MRIDLYKDGTGNYFGETYTGTQWYNGSDGKSYFPIIVSDSTASATIQGRVGNPTTSEYSGVGSYKLRVRRYTAFGSAASNDTQTPVDVQINIATPTPTPTSLPNSCNGICGSDGNCQSGLVCSSGRCRNPSCTSEEDCSCSTATPIPTSVPTLTPTATATKTLTPKPTVAVSLSPFPASDSGLVLGVQNETNPSPTPTSEEKGKSFPFYVVLIVLGGLFCLGGLGLAVWGKQKTAYNENNAQSGQDSS